MLLSGVVHSRGQLVSLDASTLRDGALTDTPILVLIANIDVRSFKYVVRVGLSKITIRSKESRNVFVAVRVKTVV